MGINRQLQGCKASYSPLPLASAYASVMASMALTAALLARERGVASAHGATIEVPLASALLEMLVHNSLSFEQPTTYSSRRRRALSAGDAPSTPLDYYDGMPASYVLHLTSYIPYILPPTSYLLPPASCLLPPTSYILHLTA